MRPTLPPLPRPLHTAARDGDLARQDARMRYSRLLLTRSQQLAADQAKYSADVWAGRRPVPEVVPTTFIGPMPKDEYHTERAYRNRMTLYNMHKQMAEIRQGQPETMAIGEGVGIGLAMVGSSIVTEAALIRLASGMRFVGATRAATVVGRLSFAEGELLGVRAGAVGYRDAFVEAGWSGVGKMAGPRFGADMIAQGGANYYGSKATGFARFKDAGANINWVESGMALYGIQPVGIGVGSALFQYSFADGYKSPLNNTLTWQAFRAQALIGMTGGYLVKGADHFLTPNLSAGLFYHSFLRGGPRLARPVWLGSRALFKTLPHAIGITEEHLENKAEERYPVKKTPADSTATGTMPADSVPTTPPNLPPPAGSSAPYHFKLLPL